MHLFLISTENSWQLWLASLLYLVSALFALIEAVRAALDRRGLKSFRFHFLTASFLFGTVRGVLTLVYISTWADHLFLLYFFGLFFPQFLQFWVFSLLVLFVVRMVHILAYFLFVLDRSPDLHVATSCSFFL